MRRRHLTLPFSDTNAETYAADTRSPEMKAGFRSAYVRLAL